MSARKLTNFYNLRFLHLYYRFAFGLSMSHIFYWTRVMIEKMYLFLLQRGIKTFNHSSVRLTRSGAG